MNRRERFNFVRSLVLFVLGVVVIIDAVLSAGTHGFELVIGLILVGYTSFDDLIGQIGSQLARRHKHDEP